MTNKYRALVVDDNEDGAKTFAAVLEVMGHTAAVVTDPRQAVAVALEKRPHIAFVDISMPHLSGYDLAIQLRGHFPRDKLCIVAVSGHADERSRRASTKAGIDAHLAKPVDPTMVEYTIDVVCRQLSPGSS
jgi:CheY-like chemotaxis protein